MVNKIKNIISVSRRGDIPAFQYKWLQDTLERKCVMLRNPMFPEKTSFVDLSPEKVHSIVLWSKDFSNVVNDPGYLNDYNLYFQYTITNYSKFLEPNVPDYNDSLRTLEKMLKRYSPEQINVRFDPIIISRKGEKEITKKPGTARLNAFDRLCSDLHKLGMDKCRLTTSYISMYGHVAERLKLSGLDMVELNEELKISFMKRMVEIASTYNRDIYTCANPLFEGIEGVKKGHCIDGDLLTNLFNEKCIKKKDSSQRENCGCSKSIDIGTYGVGSCKHGCKYCYVR